jgi:hypothetical protein
MLLREKGKKDAEPVGMGWDEAQAALRAGTHEVVETAPSSGEPRREREKPIDAEPDLDVMTRADLDKLAADRGVDVSKAGNKAEVIALLRAPAA